MLSTIVLIATFTVLLVGSIALWMVCLRLGLRWAKATGVTRGRLAMATALIVVLPIGLNVLFLLLPAALKGAALLCALVLLAAAVVGPSLIISRVFRLRFLRSLQAWAPTLLVPMAGLLVSTILVRPFLFQAFVSPTNGMAPTLLGNHVQGVCSRCGEPNFCSPLGRLGSNDQTQPMICPNFHVTEASPANSAAFSGDHFLVAQFLAQKRWDVVVYRFPGDGSTLRVARLVGLPGETITIKDGAVFADGKKLTSPGSLQGLQYLSKVPDYPEIWGSDERPAVLGSDEYFVLGDFSPQSHDSRLWEQGAPGNNPFAVPKTHLGGVVTHIYWPPRRMHVFR